MMTMRLPSMTVPRGTFSIDEPWALPPSCQPQPLRLAESGDTPRLSTWVAAYRDATTLYVRFEIEDDEVVARYHDHGQPLWEEDVVEVFLAPRYPTEYFEVEVNPLGTKFDARIESPDGVRATMQADVGWVWAGFDAMIQRERQPDGSSRALTIVRLPFAALGGVPEPGSRWRGNFFRIDRNRSGDEYSAWSPTLRSPADFHVTKAFGILSFA
jgi:hypothetical protein